MKYLKVAIVACATAVTIVKLYIDGDGVTLTALFTLYGTLVGVEVAKAASKED